MKFIGVGGIESCQIITRDLTTYDPLQLTNHYRDYRKTFQWFKDAGISLVRYPICWHNVEKTKGVFDWEMTDRLLEATREYGLKIIADPLHHVSYPLWLKDGFLDKDFSDCYTEFMFQCAKRYPWIKFCTPVNETFTAAIMCGLIAQWHPFRNDDHSFYRVAVHAAIAECKAVEMLRQELPNITIVDATPIEFHQAFPGHVTSNLEQWVTFLNDRRFLTMDLQYGRVNEQHPLYLQLTQHGINDRELAWLQDHVAMSDILGFDYYAHSSEQCWREINGSIFRADANGNPHNFAAGPKPVGLACQAQEYHRRYPTSKKMLTETNLPGSVTDRLTWLCYTASQWNTFENWLHKTGQQRYSTGCFCWFPTVDSWGWGNNMNSVPPTPDIHGLLWLENNASCWHTSILSDAYASLHSKAEIGNFIQSCSLNTELAKIFIGYREQFIQEGIPSGIWDVLDQEQEKKVA